MHRQAFLEQGGIVTPAAATVEPPRRFFAICSFISALALCSSVAYVVAITFFQCGFQWSSGWCGAAAIYTFPFWGPVVLVSSVAVASLALRATVSERFVMRTHFVVIGGVLVVILII